MTAPRTIPDGYSDLARVLDAALDQAANGKGKERHAAGREFQDQPIIAITSRRGRGFPLGQAEKKIDEADGMVSRGQISAAKAELLGAIVYLAAAYLRIDQNGYADRTAGMMPEAGNAEIDPLRSPARMAD